MHHLAALSYQPCCLSMFLDLSSLCAARHMASARPTQAPRPGRGTGRPRRWSSIDRLRSGTRLDAHARAARVHSPATATGDAYGACPPPCCERGRAAGGARHVGNARRQDSRMGRGRQRQAETPTLRLGWSRSRSIDGQRWWHAWHHTAQQIDHHPMTCGFLSLVA